MTEFAMPQLGPNTTIGQKYDPAMAITDQATADAYFEACVQHTMSFGEANRQKAEEIERSNLGYYAGYGSEETRARVERLFHCMHPIFGPVAIMGSPEEEEAIEAGKRVMREHP